MGDKYRKKMFNEINLEKLTLDWILENLYEFSKYIKSYKIFIPCKIGDLLWNYVINDSEKLLSENELEIFQLKYIDLKTIRITQRLPINFSKLLNIHNLNSLYFTDFYIEKNNNFLNFINSYNLHELTFENCYIEDFNENIKFLENLNNLKILKIINHNYSNLGNFKIFEFLNILTLVELKLEVKEFSEKNVQDINNFIIKQKNLKKLILKYNNLSLNELINLHKNSIYLEELSLDFGFYDLNSNDILNLIELLENQIYLKKLQLINLSCNKTFQSYEFHEKYDFLNGNNFNFKFNNNLEILILNIYVGSIYLNKIIGSYLIIQKNLNTLIMDNFCKIAYFFKDDVKYFL